MPKHEIWAWNGRQLWTVLWRIGVHSERKIATEWLPRNREKLVLLQLRLFENYRVKTYIRFDSILLRVTVGEQNFSDLPERFHLNEWLFWGFMPWNGEHRMWKVMVYLYRASSWTCLRCVTASHKSALISASQLYSQAPAPHGVTTDMGWTAGVSCNVPVYYPSFEKVKMCLISVSMGVCVC